MKSHWQFTRIIPVAIVMGMIFYLSHQEGSSLPLPQIPYIDKLAHFFTYSILAVTALFALPVHLGERHPERTAVALILFCLIYGISDELHQSFIPERDASPSDLLADLIGAAMVVFFWYRQLWRAPCQLSKTGLAEGIKPDNSSGIL